MWVGGDVALFRKEYISNYDMPMKEDNEDAIWVKSKKYLIGGDRDIYLGTIYVGTTLGILIFADTYFRGFRGFWPNSRKLISAKYFRSYDSRK